MSIRISRFRIDMGANPIKNLGQGTSTTDATRRDEVVLLTGDQTVAGVKTFSSSPIFPSGTINAGDNILLNPEFNVGATANLPLYWGLMGTPTLALAADTLFPALSGNQVTITSAGAGQEGILILNGTTNWLKVKPSTIYTFSIDYKCTAGDTLEVAIRSYNGAAAGSWHVGYAQLTSTTAIRYSVTFTTDADATNLQIQLGAKADGDIVIVSHPKLEEGSFATPFRPSFSELSSGQTDKTRQFNLLPAGAVIPATSGCGLTQTNGTNKSYWTLDFDTAADEYCFFHFTVPDQYDGGNVKFDIWCKSTATSGNVAFIITTADVLDSATYDASLATSIAFSAKTVDGSAGDAFVASATADPGWTAGRLAAMRLRRDTANDNAAADINVLMIEVEYEVT